MLAAAVGAEWHDARPLGANEDLEFPSLERGHGRRTGPVVSRLSIGLHDGGAGVQPRGLFSTSDAGGSRAVSGRDVTDLNGWGRNCFTRGRTPELQLHSFPSAPVV